MALNLAALASAGNRLKAAQAERDDARHAVEPLVVEAVRHQVPQTQIVELTGLTRETIRTIARKAGIEGSRSTASGSRGVISEPYEDAP